MEGVNAQCMYPNNKQSSGNVAPAVCGRGSMLSACNPLPHDSNKQTAVWPAVPEEVWSPMHAPETQAVNSNVRSCNMISSVKRLDAQSMHLKNTSIR